MAEEKTENEAHYEEKLTKLHSMINTKKKRTEKNRLCSCNGLDRKYELLHK